MSALVDQLRTSLITLQAQCVAVAPNGPPLIVPTTSSSSTGSTASTNTVSSATIASISNSASGGGGGSSSSAVGGVGEPIERRDESVRLRVARLHVADARPVSYRLFVFVFHN